MVFTTNAGIDGLDGIQVEDSIKKLKFCINEKSRDTSEYVYAYTKEGSEIENPTPSNINYDNSYCIIEYANAEGSGTIRFINDWNEFVIIYENQVVTKMLTDSIIS